MQPLWLMPCLQQCACRIVWCCIPAGGKGAEVVAAQYDGGGHAYGVVCALGGSLKSQVIVQYIGTDMGSMLRGE